MLNSCGGSPDAAHAEMFSADPVKEKPKPKAAPKEPVGALFDLEDVLRNKDGQDYSVLGVDMPRVIPPGTVGNNKEWLLWCHMRDDKIDDDVVKMSSGRICFLQPVEMVCRIGNLTKTHQ